MKTGIQRVCRFWPEIIVEKHYLLYGYHRENGGTPFHTVPGLPCFRDETVVEL